jgi:hypothetical protein
MLAFIENHFLVPDAREKILIQTVLCDNVDTSTEFFFESEVKAGNLEQAHEGALFGEYEIHIAVGGGFASGV